MGKVDHISADRRLATEVHPQEPQLHPEQPFRNGLLPAEASSQRHAACHSLRTSGPWVTGATPIPNPSPLQGEGSIDSHLKKSI